MRGVCFVHVLFLHVAKRPNGRLAQVLGTPVKFPSDSRAIAIPWHRSSSSQKSLWCRCALRVGGVRWAVEVFLGLSLKLLFCNPFLTSPKPDLLQPSLPQPGHQHILHCALRLGSFGISWITCTSLTPWATSCSPKTAELHGSGFAQSAFHSGGKCSRLLMSDFAAETGQICRFGRCCWCETYVVGF